MEDIVRHSRVMYTLNNMYYAILLARIHNYFEM